MFDLKSHLNSGGCVVAVHRRGKMYPMTDIDCAAVVQTFITLVIGDEATIETSEEKISGLVAIHARQLADFIGDEIAGASADISLFGGEDSVS